MIVLYLLVGFSFLFFHHAHVVGWTLRSSSVKFRVDYPTQRGTSGDVSDYEILTAHMNWERHNVRKLKVPCRFSITDLVTVLEYLELIFVILH